MDIPGNLNKLFTKISRLIPDWVVDFGLRVSIFLVFWQSVQTKIVGGTFFGQHTHFWNVTDNTKLLFEYEYALPLIPYDIAAYVATIAEFFLALTMLLGFLSRASAFGLLCMTAVIQFFVYPHLWQEHLVWAMMLLCLLKKGPGMLSLDRMLFKH